MRPFPPGYRTKNASLFLSMLLILALSSCIYQVHSNTTSDSLFSNKCTYPDIGPESNDLPKDITKYERILKEKPDKETLASAYLRLASLYSSHRNPSPDYARTLKLLNNYSTLEPDKAKSETFQYWYSIISYINKLRQQTAGLQKENAELKEVIEELKHLDIRIEEKRKQVK
ncbi:MAG: hypothetical protein BV458_12060 [Thermoplasmata archaeon M9B2D]|nr:MAG: hypothetical protein BV458_12060 [Thermoplasmata archaeon M9B2D]